MNQLDPPDQMHAGDTIVSANGWFTLEMMDTGALVVYRTLNREWLWNSPPLNQPGGWAVMQADGNLVTYTAAGAPYWDSGTAGNPGAFLGLLDNGNLMVRAPTRVLWQTNAVIDTSKPTIRYVAEGGYSYNETSESWKQMCQAFPCFAPMHWPGYDTAVIEEQIDGVPVVIQLWKGLCPKFEGPFGLSDLPGGIGAEVGIYRRIPGRTRSISLSGLPGGLIGGLGSLATQISDQLAHLADDQLWWPAPELATTLAFRFINHNTGEVAFAAGPETTYWLTKWMEPSSYDNYRRDHSGPADFTDYTLEYTINGKPFHHWPQSPGDLGTLGVPGWMSLLLDDPVAPGPAPPRPHRPPRPIH